MTLLAVLTSNPIMIPLTFGLVFIPDVLLLHLFVCFCSNILKYFPRMKLKGTTKKRQRKIRKILKENWFLVLGHPLS